MSQRDLDLNLSDDDRPGLVTRLLASCLAGFDTLPDAESILWDWTIEERLQGLLAIARATRAEPPPVETRCSASECRAPMRIDLDLSAFATSPGRTPIVCDMAAGERVVARLPRGLDLRHWRDAAEDTGSLATRLIESIDGRVPEPGWRLPQTWLGRLAASLAERDPLTVLQLSAACPDCGRVNLIDFDLEGWILRLLAEEQSRLLDDVHGLASTYHWSEAEICALPPWRRRAYLARVGREALP